MATGKSPPAPESSLLQGTLDTLVLRTLEAAGPLHGYAIARRIEQDSGQQWQVEEGSLYPALRRLEKRGHVAAQWKASETGRRARVYSLTQDGRKKLHEAKRSWASLAATMNQFLGITPLGAGGGGTPAAAAGGAA